MPTTIDDAIEYVQHEQLLKLGKRLAEFHAQIVTLHVVTGPQGELLTWAIEKLAKAEGLPPG